MSNEILEEVYRARDLLWERAGGTMRGLGEFLRECRRRADAGEYAWDLLSPQSEAIAAEVRARLAKEELKGALCVREEREGYGRAEARGGRGSATKGTKDTKRGARRAVKRERRKVKNGGGNAKQAEPLE